MLLLLTNQKYECQQCQKEHSEGHQILKIKTILHWHHLHSVRMKVTHPLPYGMYTIAGSPSATNFIIPQSLPEHKFYLTFLIYILYIFRSNSFFPVFFCSSFIFLLISIHFQFFFFYFIIFLYKCLICLLHVFFKT